MTASVKTVAFQGMDVLAIDVQVHMANGLPAFTIVGLPDKAVAESRERVRAALVSVRGLYESDESVIRRPLLKS